VQPAFQLTAENAPTIVEICRQLDGLPLAIELAAARIKSLTPQSMLQQLDRRLEWLTRGSRDSLKQTLRGTIEWSYNLLSEPERILLRRLAVFADGCTLPAAESVCADSLNENNEARLRRADILELLIKLIDKSLVSTKTNAQQMRYHVFETMREFGREKLAQAGELDEVLTRHLICFAEYAEESERHLDGTEQGKWIRITEQEHGNFHAAMDYALANPQVSAYGLRIGASISLYWLERNHFQESAEWLGKLLDKAAAPEHRHLRAKMLYRSGAIQTRAANYNTAYKLCEQSIEIARTLDDKRILPTALCYLGQVCTAIKDYPKARQLLEESAAICRAANLTNDLAITLIDLGRVLLEQGEMEQADTTGREALALAEKVNDTWAVSHALLFMGSFHRSIEKRAAAIENFERSLSYIREIGDRLSEGVVFANLSILYYVNSDFPASGNAAEKSFAAFQAIGDELQQPFPLRMMGYSAVNAGNIIRARALIRESLKGNHELDHLAGQLACLIALGTCELVQENIEKAATYAALAANRINADAISLMEPDTIALGKLLEAAKNKLGNKSFKQIIEKSKDLHVEDLIASELSSAA
jgi:non-specific serine/threonine protein kinase